MEKMTWCPANSHDGILEESSGQWDAASTTDVVMHFSIVGWERTPWCRQDANAARFLPDALAFLKRTCGAELLPGQGSADQGVASWRYPIAASPATYIDFLRRVEARWST